MNKVKQFLAAHNVTAHTVAAAWMALVGLYATSAPFASFVNDIWAMVPSAGHKAIGALMPVIALYFKSTQSTK